MNIPSIFNTPRTWNSESSITAIAPLPRQAQTVPVRQLAQPTTPSTQPQSAGSSSNAPFDIVTQVSTPQEDSDDLTYGALGLIHVRSGQLQAWERASNDAISNVMARNASGFTAQNRLTGLGAALLKHIGDNGTSYRQTVVNVAAPQGKQKIQDRATQALHSIQETPTERVELRIKTRSGTTVTLTIVDQREAGLNGTGISTEIRMDGELTANERKALAAMANGVETAIQGLAAGEAQIDLKGLAEFDGNAIASMELKTNVYGRNEHGVRYEKLGAQFTADATTRAIRLSTQQGEIRMSVDLRHPALWGNAAQKSKAVNQYLTRIDQAGKRGHADENLVAMFKSTFVSLNATYGAQSTERDLQGLTTDSTAWSDEDKSWLTGLADFNTTLTSTPKASNPRHSQELDRFSYTLRQSTTVTGTEKSNRGVTQTQDSSLVAAYHRSLTSSRKPALDSTAASQNYFYNQVDDSAHTQVDLGYQKNALVAATLTKHLTESLRTQKFEHNKLVEDHVIPAERSSVLDLLPLLSDLQSRENDHQITATEKRTLLERWNDLLFEEPAAAGAQSTSVR